MQTELQHLSLPTACAVVYSKIAGVTPDPRDPAKMQAILNDVAQALSNIVPIYAPDPASGKPKALTPLELVEGKFTRGAQAFKTKSGAELRGLTVQRRDLASALTILKSAQIRFRRPDEDDGGKR